MLTYYFLNNETLPSKAKGGEKNLIVSNYFIPVLTDIKTKSMIKN